MKSAVVVAVHAPFETERYYVINGNIRITETHPVLSRGGWVDVGDLEVGDPLTDSRGHAQTIFSIKEVDETARTYNFQVSGGTYVAGGIVVHNKENCEHFMQYPN
jgi:intein/homing endonuclease